MSDLTEFFGKEQEGFTAEDAPVSFVPGKLPCIIKAASVERTRKQTGHYIALRLTPLEGPREETLFVNINIDNPNEDCVRIGLRILTSLREALGLLALTDTDQVVDKIVIAHVKIKDGQPDVRTFSAPGIDQPPAVVAPAPPASGPQAPSPAAPPQQPQQSANPAIGMAHSLAGPEAQQRQNTAAPARPWERQ